MPTKAGRAARYHRPRWFDVLVGVVALIALASAIPAFTQQPHEPSIADFFPEPLFGAGTWFAFDRITLARVLSAAVLIVVMVLAAGRAALVPSRFQSLVELGVTSVERFVGSDLLGKKRGRQYAPILVTIFFGTLFMNLTGLIPGINIAASSVMAVPAAFALLSYVTFLGAGFRAQGVWGYFKSMLFPPGLPWPVYILITPIEAFSTLLVRPGTLAIRLLANMVSGHLLLAITYFGTTALLASVWALKPIAILTFAGALAATLFELFIDVLQAFIFAILTAVYIQSSVGAH